MDSMIGFQIWNSATGFYTWLILIDALKIAKIVIEADLLQICASEPLDA